MLRVLLGVVQAKRAAKDDPLASLLEEYVRRSSRFSVCELKRFADEASFVDSLERSSRRSFVVLTDSRGKQVSSEELADALREAGNRAVQQVVVAVGPADGWSEAARRKADLLMAFGRITLPHELAAVVAAEQVYRALTILAGHPYHGGH